MRCAGGPRLRGGENDPASVMQEIHESIFQKLHGSVRGAVFALSELRGGWGKRERRDGERDEDEWMEPFWEFQERGGDGEGEGDGEEEGEGDKREEAEGGEEAATAEGAGEGAEKEEKTAPLRPSAWRKDFVHFPLLFWDFLSLHQRTAERERTSEEDQLFK
eukprot:Cvel_18000.t1-p1 / transcript=Cvel_18000.t1 / gene=Cvel_18000 / organism=Chromera_velia_CCMP2878 / gene_product=hypothetical protein / transcript_product=hypothetical protein / location=Cvel_scaffold1467:28531-29013(-) / protein_length=161 / sequence_SO=supercontig / SO=protein_coding / is_pseudo=false